MNEDAITYRLLGFEDRPVTLQDFRPSSMETVTTLLGDEHAARFGSKFNRPSNLLLFTGTKGEILIQLMETTTTEPLYMFWVAAGYGETLPLTHSCLFQDERRLPDNRKVFVSLHKRLYRGHIPADRGPAVSQGSLAQILEMDRSNR